MNTDKDSTTQPGAANPQRAWRRWTIAAALAVAAGTAFAGYANGLPAVHGPHRHMATTPEAMQAHIDRMVEQCAGDASADQKARLAAIARAAIADLGPVHEQFRKDHARAHALLTAPAIDRAALEQWRAAQVQAIDAMSRRVLAAVEDGAEQLTPEQRAACAGRLGMPMP
jgi:Spy/CpxP family protein refolding chaperone